jgi:hypothetical protein
MVRFITVIFIYNSAYARGAAGFVSSDFFLIINLLLLNAKSNLFMAWKYSLSDMGDLYNLDFAMYFMHYVHAKS